MNPSPFPDLKLIDGHAHLHDIQNIEQAIRNAAAVGVTRIIAVGMDMASNVRTIDLAERFPGVIYPAIGYHPWSIKEDEVEDTLSFVEEHLDSCIAVGEVGLDYGVKVKKPLQQEVFSRVIGFAKKWKKPLIVHSRYSYQRTYAMVFQSGVKRAVFHWFSGPLDILDRIIESGYLVSATPALAYSLHHQAAIGRAPLEQILIETDAPVEYREKISEPATLTNTLDALSRLKDRPEGEVARITTENAIRFFGL